MQVGQRWWWAWPRVYSGVCRLRRRQSSAARCWALALTHTPALWAPAAAALSRTADLDDEVQLVQLEMDARLNERAAKQELLRCARQRGSWRLGGGCSVGNMGDCRPATRCCVTQHLRGLLLLLPARHPWPPHPAPPHCGRALQAASAGAGGAAGAGGGAEPAVPREGLPHSGAAGAAAGRGAQRGQVIGTLRRPARQPGRGSQLDGRACCASAAARVLWHWEGLLARWGAAAGLAVSSGPQLGLPAERWAPVPFAAFCLGVVWRSWRRKHVAKQRVGARALAMLRRPSSAAEGCAPRG